MSTGWCNCNQFKTAQSPNFVAFSNSPPLSATKFPEIRHFPSSRASNQWRNCLKNQIKPKIMIRVPLNRSCRKHGSIETLENFINDLHFGSGMCASNPWKTRLQKQIRAEIEIRVCVNKSCRRDGSRETLELLKDLAPANVSVNSCGCLGRCGAGPNLVVLPGEVFVSHCGSAANALDLLANFCGATDNSNSLSALALRKKAELELEKGNFSEAEILLSQAVDLKPSGGLQFVYKTRSVARLAMGNYSGALEDAEEAARIAPKWPQAYIFQGDTFFAMGDFAAAEKAYSAALRIDPSVRRSKSFKARVTKLQEKLIAANIST